MDTEHTHDLVRVEDEQNGQAWKTCRSCRFRTEAEPWAPMTADELAAFNDERARAAQNGES